MPRTGRPARWRRWSGSGAPSSTHPPADLFERDAEAHRLYHVIHRARLEPAQLLGLAAVHRRKHDTKFSRALLLQLLEDRVAVERGEIDIEQEQRRLCATPRVHGLEQVQRLAAVAKVEEAVPPGLEPEREQLGERGIVLDDTHFGHVAPFGYGRSPACWSDRARCVVRCCGR